jgi:hypothetical protein
MDGDIKFFSLDERSTLKALRMSVSHDTTGLRAERKFTANGAQYTYALRKLSRVFGSRLTLRDPPPPGKLNLTETEYVNPYKFDEGGDIFTAKFRIRKYLTYDKETGQIEHAAITKRKSWMEFKVDHPEHENVVTKHRVLAPDPVIERLMKAGLNHHEKNEILEILNQEPANQCPKFVNEFLKLFTSLHPEGAKSILGIVYYRNAFQIRMPTRSGKKLDVQITIDQSVNFKAPRTSDPLLKYPRGARVVEIKVPLSHANLDDEAIADAPELLHIRWLCHYFSDRLLPDFTEDVGKFGHFKKLYQ